MQGRTYSSYNSYAVNTHLGIGENRGSIVAVATTRPCDIWVVLSSDSATEDGAAAGGGHRRGQFSERNERRLGYVRHEPETRRRRRSHYKQGYVRPHCRQRPGGADSSINGRVRAQHFLRGGAAEQCRRIYSGEMLVLKGGQ